MRADNGLSSPAMMAVDGVSERGVHLSCMAHKEELAQQRSLSEALQMRAWFANTRPVEYQRREQALLIAELGEDLAGYDRLEGEMIAVWREHRDDRLPPQQRRSAELAQSIAWLGRGQGLDWRHAHAMAVTADEREADIDHLIGLWRYHRENPVLPQSVPRHVSSLLQIRQTRLSEAITWHQDHDRSAHGQWEQQKGFANTLAEAWSDDRTLIRSWLDHTATASAATGRSAGQEASTHPTPRRTRSQGRSHPSCFGDSPHREGTGPGL